MLRYLHVLALALLLGGCASFNDLSSEVSTYGSWPAQSRPSTFVFERLPSQQVQPERQQELENAARGALEATGFRAAADPASADFLVQIGARVIDNNPWIYNDSLFWRGGWYGRWGRPGWGGPGWGPGWGYPWTGPWGYDMRSFEREVVLLIRDRQTGQLLYETHANNTGPSPAIDQLLPAMFAAAMKNFPQVGPNPRNVTTQIAPTVAPAPVPAPPIAPT